MLTSCYCSLVVGTYSLHRDDPDDLEPAKEQYRNGSLCLLKCVDNQLYVFFFLAWYVFGTILVSFEVAHLRQDFEFEVRGHVKVVQSGNLLHEICCLKSYPNIGSRRCL